MRGVELIFLAFLIGIGFDVARGQSPAKDFPKKYVMDRCVNGILDKMPGTKLKSLETYGPNSTFIGRAEFESEESVLWFSLNLEKSNEAARHKIQLYSKVSTAVYTGPIEMPEIGDAGGWRYEWWGGISGRASSSIHFSRCRVIAEVSAELKEDLAEISEDAHHTIKTRLGVLERAGKLARLLNAELKDLCEDSLVSPLPEADSDLTTSIEALNRSTPDQPSWMNSYRTYELIDRLAETKDPRVLVPLIRSFAVYSSGGASSSMYSLHHAILLANPQLLLPLRHTEAYEIERQIRQLRDHHDIIPALKHLGGVERLDEKTEAELLGYFHHWIPAINAVKRNFGESAIPALLQEALNSDQTWYRERIALAMRAILSRAKIAALKNQHHRAIAENPGVGEFFEMLTREDFSVDVTIRIVVPSPTGSANIPQERP